MMALLGNELVHWKKHTHKPCPFQCLRAHINQELFSEGVEVKQFPPLESFQTIFFNPKGNGRELAVFLSQAEGQHPGCVSPLLSDKHSQVRCLGYDFASPGCFPEEWRAHIFLSMLRCDARRAGLSEWTSLDSRSGNANPPRSRR